MIGAGTGKSAFFDFGRNFRLTVGMAANAIAAGLIHLTLTYSLRNLIMSFSAQDVVPISEARARLTELSDEVVAGAEKLLTKNGAAYVAIVDARKLDYYHALEAEHANLVLLSEAETGLRDVLAGRRVSNADLLKALA
jgi:prevent-host-death family protein